jgi:hypothetical protein
LTYPLGWNKRGLLSPDSSDRSPPILTKQDQSERTRAREKESLDRPRARRLSWFNAVGILVALSSPLLIERNLSSLILVHRPVWPWTVHWFVSLMMAMACATVVGFLTYVCLDHKQSGGRNGWVAPLTVGAPIMVLSLFFRWGKWPHMGMWCWAFAFGALSHVFVVCRKARHMVGVNRSLEGLKATLSTWQLITVYALTAYLAFVIFQLYLVWLISQDLVSSREERLLFAACSACQLVIFSSLIFMGPLREAWQMTFETVATLSKHVKAIDQ